jgi:fumarate reductase subunit C
MERTLFLAQRISAIILGPLVLVHLGLILFAVRNGLSGAEILSRTQGSISWSVFYGLFVLSITVHTPIGLRNILQEWTRISQRTINIIALLFALIFLALGLRAVVAIV